MAKRELQSWRLLQLEPSSLRRPDETTAPTKIGHDGSHLASTLYNLPKAKSNERTSSTDESILELEVFTRLSNRLSELIDDVKCVSVDYDQKRELLTVLVTSRDGTPHSARSLSDGTLRFLALAVLEQDPEAKGIICLEEPENGIHPERIPAMLCLLKDIATDVDEPTGPDNPLRQVIINTHSPSVVAQIPDESLIIADLVEIKRGDRTFKVTRFSALPDTWRHKAPEGCKSITKGKLLAYLNPVGQEVVDASSQKGQKNRHRRVVDRSDIQQLLPFSCDIK